MTKKPSKFVQDQIADFEADVKKKLQERLAKKQEQEKLLIDKKKEEKKKFNDFI